MRNTGLEETQAGIKIVGGSINISSIIFLSSPGCMNMPYADDTTLMAENEEELKSLLLKVKKESEKAG